MAPSANSLLGRADRTIQTLLASLTAASLLVMTITVLALVIARFAFGIGIFWGEELARFAMIYMGMIGAAVAIRGEQHPRLTLFANMLPEGARKLLEALVSLLMLITLAFLLWQGWEFFQFDGSMLTPALRIPFGWVFFAIPFGAAAMIVQVAARHFYPPVLTYAEEDDVEGAVE